MKIILCEVSSLYKDCYLCSLTFLSLFSYRCKEFFTYMPTGTIRFRDYLVTVIIKHKKITSLLLKHKSRL